MNRKRRVIKGIKAIFADFNRRSGTRRGKATIVVKRTGFGGLNAAAHKLYLVSCRQLGIDPDQAAAELGVSEDESLVTVRLVEQGTPGSVPIRNYMRYRICTVHLGPVFEEYPDLIPEGKVACPVYLDENEAGEPILSIAIKGGVAVQTRRRKDSDQRNKAQPEPEPAADAAPAEQSPAPKPNDDDLDEEMLDDLEAEEHEEEEPVE